MDKDQLWFPAYHTIVPSWNKFCSLPNSALFKNISYVLNVHSMPEIKIVQETSIYPLFSFIFPHLTSRGYLIILSSSIIPCLSPYTHTRYTHFPPQPFQDTLHVPSALLLRW